MKHSKANQTEKTPEQVGHTPGDSSKEGLQDKHTPLPWNIGYGHNSNSYGIFTKRMLDYGYEEPPICLISPLEQISERDKANAELIVKAVNNYQALFQMVKDLKGCIKRLSQDDLTQFDRDKEAQWEGEAHELLSRIDANYYRNANE